MKFFTGSHSNEVSEDDREHFAAINAYKDHLVSLSGRVPDHVLDLARMDGIDDGLIVSANHKRTARRMMLTLFCGYVQMGYFNLTLDYEEAEISEEDDRTLAMLANLTGIPPRKNCDLTAHEIDLLDDGRIEHRFLFFLIMEGRWIEFAIRCRSLTWKKSTVDSGFPFIADRYPGGPT